MLTHVLQKIHIWMAFKIQDMLKHINHLIWKWNSKSGKYFFLLRFQPLHNEKWWKGDVFFSVCVFEKVRKVIFEWQAKHEFSEMPIAGSRQIWNLDWLQPTLRVTDKLQNFDLDRVIISFNFYHHRSIVIYPWQSSVTFSDVLLLFTKNFQVFNFVSKCFKHALT